jgi:hypothetical protein
MGVISRIKSWVSGEVLESADLNSEFDNILNLVNGNIEAANISNGTVGTDELANLAVTKAKLGADAVDGTKIEDAAVDSEHIASDAIQQSHIDADAIGGTEIADDAVRAEHIKGFTGTDTVSLDNIPQGATYKSIDVTAGSGSIDHADTSKPMIVPSAAFVPATSLGADVSQNFLRPAAADGSNYAAHAAVYFPDGAVIDDMTGYGDTAAGPGTDKSVQVSLFRGAKDSGTIAAMATVTFADGTDNNTDSSVSNATIDNANYRYLLAVIISAEATGTINDSKLFSVLINYTSTNLGQTI